MTRKSTTNTSTINFIAKSKKLSKKLFCARFFVFHFRGFPSLQSQLLGLLKTIFGILRNVYDYIKKKIIYYVILIVSPKSSLTPLATSPYLWGRSRMRHAPFVLCFYILCLSLFCLLFISVLSVLGSWIQNETYGVYPFSVCLIALLVAGIPVVLLWILAYPIIMGKDVQDSQDWWMAWVYVNWKLRKIRYHEDTEKKS